MTLASNLYLAELVNREPSGARKALFSVHAWASGLLGGFVPEPRSADVVVRPHTSSTPITTIAVDTHDAADVLRKVQDDLDRLDVATFRQEWGIR